MPEHTASDLPGIEPVAGRSVDAKVLDSCTYCGAIPAAIYYEVPDNLRYRSEGKEFVAGTVRVACTECDELIVAARVDALVERMETEWSGASRQRRRDAVEHFHNVVTVRTPILSAPRPD